MAVFGKGGCLCGGVRYVCQEAPQMTGICHCRDCQRNSGSAFATLLIFKKDTVDVTGLSLSTYAHNGGSGQKVYRSFCRECGSPVIWGAMYAKKRPK